MTSGEWQKVGSQRRKSPRRIESVPGLEERAKKVDEGDGIQSRSCREWSCLLVVGGRGTMENSRGSGVDVGMDPVIITGCQV